MDEKFKQICQSSLKLFLDYGIKNVSMDDISKHMHISKKTLYQYVDNKEDLLVKILNGIKQTHENPKDDSWKCGKNAIEILFFASQKIYEFQIRVKNPFRFDLHKYYPHLWDDFSEAMRYKTRRYLVQNIVDGIREGFYREDLDIDMTATLYMAKIDGVHADFARDPEKYTYRQLFEALFEHQIRAIATTKGLNFLEEKLESFRLDFEKK